MRETAAGLLGTSDAVRGLREEVARASSSDANVLITGETGTGKEVVAQLVHAQSARARRRPLIALNCAGVPEPLLESELFGHERGSFTGAELHRQGLFKAADGGTVLLDEVGEMSPRMQALLLRFLDCGEIQRVGAASTTRTDVRLIAATNRDLVSSVATSEFRLDLFYRLNVLRLHTTALRDRREDIPLLFAHFLGLYSRGGLAPVLTPGAVETLVHHEWPGNVRQLRNVAERLVVRWAGRTLDSRDVSRELALTVPSGGRETRGRAARANPTRADDLYRRVTEGGESFWAVVHDPFMARDLTRNEVRSVVARGLKETHGKYKPLLRLFNMKDQDYKRLLSFLQKRDLLALPSPRADCSLVA